jgi:hypothetical protein
MISIFLLGATPEPHYMEPKLAVRKTLETPIVVKAKVPGMHG